ncbi:hypothetical protein BKA70DRAFT_1438289 [Coprinopsis sp. MPI-PUGE-AT-0042]|nr:hypothetical protein BKA70DRAFT_1438289 [Coprinopsis sp. MPI-PUGE-AT-0042]
MIHTLQAPEKLMAAQLLETRQAQLNANFIECGALREEERRVGDQDGMHKEHDGSQPNRHKCEGEGDGNVPPPSSLKHSSLNFSSEVMVLDMKLSSSTLAQGPTPANPYALPCGNFEKLSSVHHGWRRNRRNSCMLPWSTARRLVQSFHDEDDDLLRLIYTSDPNILNIVR